MDIYLETSYKTVLRGRIKEWGKTKRLTLRKVAEKIQIQYTYLSKALNSDTVHISEDHLFLMCKILEFLPEEMDYLFLLRSQAVTSDPSRKAYLHNKIGRIQKSRELNVDFQPFDSRHLNREMDYLFSPLCLLVHVALFIPAYRDNPRKLCPVLAITPQGLLQILNTLNQLGFIQLDPHTQKVKKALKQFIHYGVDHPLMRIHQSLLKQASSNRILATAEEDKHCFMTTFTSDVDTFKKVKKKFQAFIKEVEVLARKSSSEQVFQLNFDLFKWF